MTISSYFAPGRFGLSYELFPPKTDKGTSALFGHLGDLLRFKPDFVTCTYGAGGSTRGTTLGICKRVKQEFGLPVASHLTVVGSTRDELRQYLREAQEAGVDYIVALRGDPPQGTEEFRPVDGGLSYANELVSLIKDESFDFGIAVAGYPETHQECSSPSLDLENLKRKVDAGADIIVTQLFYHNDDYFQFVEKCQNLGITIPIVPGVLPVTDLGQIQRLTSMCGAKLPTSLVDRLSERDDPEWQFQQGVDFAIKQVQELIDHGIPGLHFYVLNKSQATLKVLDSVSLPEAWQSET
jgi:methylenetetrahydrofolate reductase (NADPH)